MNFIILLKDSTWTAYYINLVFKLKLGFSLFNKDDNEDDE